MHLTCCSSRSTTWWHGYSWHATAECCTANVSATATTTTTTHSTTSLATTGDTPATALAQTGAFVLISIRRYVEWKRLQVTGKNYIAVYDYTAADTDEVTFVEGDTIVNCQHVDEGWMTGTVQRTKQWGMLPANYVEPLK